MIVLHRGLTLLTACLLLVGLLAFPPKAAACSCIGPGTVQERKDGHHAVFDGTVIASKSTGKSLFQSDVPAIKTSFRVHEVWKGLVTPELTVLTAESSASCGSHFQTGERYIVHAYERNGKLETSLCSGNLLYSEAGAELIDYGSGSVPPEPSGAENSLRSPIAGPFAWLSGLLIIIGALAFIGYRRSKTFKSKI